MLQIARSDNNANALMPVQPAIAVFREKMQSRAAELKAKSKSDATRRAYASDWRQFTAWCSFVGYTPLPALPETVAEYLGTLTIAKTPRGSDYSTATIARRLAAIAHFHRSAAAADPTTDENVKAVMSGIARERAGVPTAQKSAMLTKSLKKGLRRELRKPADYRDRAMMLVGFAGAFRRSELIGMDIEHLTFDDEGRMSIRLPKSKTNQTGEPETIWILAAGDHCPVRALREWLRVSGITEGAVWRAVDRHGNLKARLSTDAVAYIVKRTAARAGLDPRQFSGHSLRAGHVTQAFLAETPIELIQQQTRHRSVDTLMRYYRDLKPQQHNSSSHLGL